MRRGSGLQRVRGAPQPEGARKDAIIRAGCFMAHDDAAWRGHLFPARNGTQENLSTQTAAIALAGSEKSAMLPQGSATQDENSRNGGSNEVRRGKRGRIFFGAESP
jgi:hypothetical protein